METEGAGWWIGADVGGTFTDIVAVHSDTSEFRTGKVLTTKDEQEVGVMDAIQALEIPFTDISEVVHGHTVGINALLNRTGSEAALLTTIGHRDLLDIGRMDREYGPSFYDPSWLRPHQRRPIIPRRLRIPIVERITGDGGIALALDEDQVRATARQLGEVGVAGVGICFVNSYISQAHELRAAQIVREELPDVYVQTSAIYPVTKEAERTNTVALDAYVGPVVSRYIRRLEEALRANEFTGQLWIMIMNGGVRSPEEAGRVPVFQLQSGPVGGVTAAVQYARRSGHLDLMSMDIGGTSTDVAAIQGGSAPLTDTWSLEHGLTLTMPVVNVGSIGSGAGSIIYVDHQGVLHVGPEAAGATPGPACYGRGGTRATLTDACVLLGILQPDQFAGGRIPLDASKATAALASTADSLGMSAIDLAAGAYDVACSDIAATLRTVSTERGLDVREFKLLAFGAAGPMLAAEVARRLRATEVVVPAHPGQFSALGLISTALRVTEASSPHTVLTPDAAVRLEEDLEALENRAAGKIAGQSRRNDISFERAVYVMYMGQTWDNRIPLADGKLSSERVPELVRSVHQFYENQYGYSAPELPIIITSLEVTASAPRPTAPTLTATRVHGDKQIKTAAVYFGGTAHRDVPFLRREALPTGATLDGPVVIVDPYSTIPVPPGAAARVTDDTTIHIALSEGGQHAHD
jgi:N-methylhydantoinase A